MSDEVNNKEENDGEVIPPEKERKEGVAIPASMMEKVAEFGGEMVKAYIENSAKEHEYKLRRVEYDEKVLAAHKTVFSWQFWTVSGFLAAILFSGLYMWVTSETKSDEGMLIVSHFAFGIFGVIAGFGIKSAANK